MKSSRGMGVSFFSIWARVFFRFSSTLKWRLRRIEWKNMLEVNKIWKKFIRKRERLNMSELMWINLTVPRVVKCDWIGWGGRCCEVGKVHFLLLSGNNRLANRRWKILFNGKTIQTLNTNKLLNSCSSQN